MRIPNPIRPPNPSCLPRLLPGGKTGILLLHGYTGYPGEMYFLGERLNAAGYTVAIPRLPGHGTDIDDFLHSTAEDWLRRVQDAWLDLAGSCERVYVGGLSMGGALALILASKLPVAGCLLYAPAVAINSRILPYIHLLRPFIKRIANPAGQDETEPDRRYLADRYWSWRYTHGLAELWKISRLARQSLTRLSCDTLVIVSEKDHAVRLEAGTLIQQKAVQAASITLFTLKESGHVIVNDCERDTAARLSLQWLAERQPN